MTNNDFKYWLRGFAELCYQHEKDLNRDQLSVILNHINLTEAVSHKLTDENKHIRKLILDCILSERDLNINLLLDLYS